MNSAMIAIIKKDIKEITHSPATFVPMIIVPIVITTVIPVVFILLSKFAGAQQINGMEQLTALIAHYPLPDNISGLMDQMVYVFLNYTFVSLFLIVPVMVTAIIGTNGIVGERERKTLETLLYAPLDQGDFLKAKALAALIPGVVIAWGSWLLMFLSGNGLSLALGGPLLISSPLWILVLLIMVPTLTLLELSVTLFVSMKAKTFMDAQQLSSLVVLPLVALMYGQIAGVVVLSPLFVATLSVVLGMVAWLLLKIVGRWYTREALISRL